MNPAIPLLRFDPQGLTVRGSGFSPELLEFVYPQLETARQDLLGLAPPAPAGATRATGLPAADVDVVALPDRIIADYRAGRQASELGRILTTARRLAEAVDRVVVVAGPATLLAVRALTSACCHPYHNELSRAERGGQPRMYFAGDSLDNDALAGLVDLVSRETHSAGPQDLWGLILIDDQHETKSTSAARGALLAALKKSTGGDRERHTQRCVAICQPGGAADRLAGESGCERFELAAGAGGPRSVFAAAGLLSAAVLGIDVRRLLEGAARLTAQFRELPAAENLVLRYVGACHLLEDQVRGWTPELVAWADGLGPLARWQAELRTAALDPRTNPATNRLRGPQAPRTFDVNLLVDAARRDRISVDGAPAHGSSPFLPDVLAAQVELARQQAAAARQPWAALHVPHLDAPCVGQLFQLFLLAPLVAQRLPSVVRASHAVAPAPNP